VGLEAAACERLAGARDPIDLRDQIHVDAADYDNWFHAKGP
jgi:hypothetical protein